MVKNSCEGRLSSGTRSLLKDKVRKWRQYLREKSSFNLKQYCLSRKNAKKSLAKDAASFNRMLSEKSKNNPKVFWSHINRRLRSTPGISLLKEGSSYITEPAKIANKFNRTFQNVFTKE